MLTSPQPTLLQRLLSFGLAACVTMSVLAGIDSLTVPASNADQMSATGQGPRA
jgi:hypothetical protein